MSNTPEKNGRRDARNFNDHCSYTSVNSRQEWKRGYDAEQARMDAEEAAETRRSKRSLKECIDEADSVYELKEIIEAIAVAAGLDLYEPLP